MKQSRRLAAALAAAVLATIGVATGTANAAPAHHRGGVDFAGIVALSNCSGAVVRFADSTPADRALVLTNGHCLENGMPEPGEVLTNQPSSRTFDVLDAAGDRTIATLHARSMLYATMTVTDVAVYQLTDTYAQLRRWTAPLTLAEKHPTAGTDIAVVSGFWQTIYSCAIDGFAYQLKEDGYVAEDSIRYTKDCQTIGGTSGSPVIDPSSHRVVGVNNTGYEGTGPDCSLDNPCEVDEDGNVTVHPNTNYGQQTYQLYGCIAADGTLTLDADCDLPH